MEYPITYHDDGKEKRQSIEAVAEIPGQVDGVQFRGWGSTQDEAKAELMSAARSLRNHVTNFLDYHENDGVDT